MNKIQASDVSNPGRETMQFNPDNGQSLLEQQQVLTRAIARIRESLELDEILKTTAREVRQFLESDRVGVFRFDPQRDWEGKFVAEDQDGKWKSALAEQIYDSCFSERFATLYQKGRIHTIADIHQDQLSDCYRQILQNFQIRANIVVPLHKGKELWGLLCVHQCSRPRQWQSWEIDFIGQIAEHLSIALQQAEYLELAKSQAAQLAHTQEQQRTVERQKALTLTIEKIRQSLDLNTIFQTATTEVRKLLNADRVTIYRFNPDWGGEFVAEAVVSGWQPFLQQQQNNPQFGHNISECSLKNLAAPVPDTYIQATQGGPFSPESVFRICDDIYQAGFSDCYIRALERYQTRAYTIVAIYHEQKLWGLLAASQNSGSRHWESDEIAVLVQIGAQLGVALQQAQYLQKVETQAQQLAKAAERQKALLTTVEKIRQSLNLHTIFETATQEVRPLLEVDRVAIYRFNSDWSGTFVAESVAKGWTPVLGTNPFLKDTYLQETQGGRYVNNETLAVDDIYCMDYGNCHLSLLEQMQVRAYAIAPIFQGCTLWGILAAYQNSAPHHWQDEEINLLVQISSQLGVALQQAELLERAQRWAEQQQQRAEQQKTVTRAIARIRESLDLKTIFKTTTTELRQLLAVDRVATFHFSEEANWSGIFVSEDVGPGWEAAIYAGVEDHCFNKTFAFQYQQGRIQAIADIYDAGLSDCYVAMLERFQIRANLVMPLFKGDELWGLLCIHQCSGSRVWKDAEIEFVKQIAENLSVALQQVDLLEQTQRQKEQLARTVQDLKQSQTQLIQSEKMASLGQLVAGVAHEINNPVNFIYGNLSHIDEYARDLLHLTHLFQENYPNPLSVVSEQIEAIDLDFLREDLPKILASMKIGAERIRQLVLSLRTFSRLDEAQMKPVDIHEGIDSTLLILQHRLKPKVERQEIQVIKEYGQLPLVDCYAAQLNQVFMNILSNSIDALEAKMGEQQAWDDAGGKGAKNGNPQIHIGTQVSGSRAVIRITDNGPGIPKATRSRIFDPFFTTKAPGKGTGLGLSISYQIVVEKHGGKLELESKLGKGTLFLVEIPIKRVV
jgi:GAF domain-containing protein